jgi:hypothetical protein
MEIYRAVLEDPRSSLSLIRDVYVTMWQCGDGMKVFDDQENHPSKRNRKVAENVLDIVCPDWRDIDELDE